MEIFSRQTLGPSSIIVLMFNKLIFAAVVLCFSLNPTGEAYSKTDFEIDEEIQNVVSQRHPKDTPEWWRGLGPTAPRVMIALYEKSDQTYVRLRLVEGLAYFSEDSKAVEFLKQQADLTSDDVIRNSAIRSVGISQGAKEIDFVSKYLHHTDAQTRLMAAQTIQGINDPQVKTLLEQYKKEEKAKWIIDRLNGRFQTPTQPLEIVSSSEDRVNPILSGVWSGVLIYPLLSKSGMTVVTAELKFEGKTKSELKGKISLLFKKKATQNFVLKGLFNKGVLLKGLLPKEISPILDVRKNKIQDFEFDGDIQEFQSLYLLRLSLPQLGGNLIVRRNN